MGKVRGISFRWFHGEGTERLHFLHAEGWRPAINAYRCEGAIRVCVDLAGVAKEEIDLQVEPKRLVVRGRRPAPEPCGEEPRARQILAMEIDHGVFSRELVFSAEVLPQETTAEQRNGLLWINLPLKQST